MNRFQKYLAAVGFGTFLMIPAVLRADCPDGGRTTSDAERQAFMAALNSIKDVPPAAAGWQLQLPKSWYTEAPTFTCKGMKLTAHYDVTYVWTEQQRLNQQRYSETTARIAALERLSPEEQSQMTDLNRQGSQLGNQARTAQKNKNPEEAARLFRQANECYAKAKAIKQAHIEKVSPQAKVIQDEYYATQITPEVKVSVVADDEPIVASAGEVEDVHIAGIPRAFFDRSKSLIISLGRDAAGRNIRVEIKGVRDLALRVGGFFSESSLLRLAVK